MTDAHQPRPHGRGRATGKGTAVQLGTRSYDAQLRQAEVLFFDGLGAWAHDTFARLNEACFGGLLTPRPVLWGLTPHGRSLGYYHAGSRRIVLHESLIRPSGDAWGQASLLGPRYAEDVLLHEMVHAAQHELRGGPLGREANGPHNEPVWCAEIERLTPLLGLPPIKARPVKPRRVNGSVSRRPRDGCLSQGQIARWPHCLRPAEYYEAGVRHLLDAA
jgi:hypothetical protein